MDSAKESVELFGMRIDALGMDQAATRILQWCDRRPPRCRFVVTPNVDHVVAHQTNAALRRAYRNASLVLADGAPVVFISKLLGRRLPARVAGSDLAPALFQRAQNWSTAQGRPLRVFLLGAAPGVAQRAQGRIQKKWPAVHVVGTHSPPLGFERNEAENERIFAAISRARPDLVLVGLGAPKQELWTHQYADRIDAAAALCVGATIDFLAGEKRRAPRWMQRSGLEWCHRLCSEPKRLARRYFRDAWLFPQIVWREWRTN